VGDGPWPAGVLLGAVVVVAMIPFLLRQARRVMSSSQPFLDAARAIALLVTLTVVGFSATHYAIAQHTSGQLEGIHTKLDALYFTVTVLSTVGFGDIHPTGQLARAVVTGQMVFDLVVLAVGVRLVTWAARSGDRGRLRAPRPVPGPDGG
jgi:voltage-gated potassium channel